MLSRQRRNGAQKMKPLARTLESGKSSALCIMLKRIYKESHLTAIALAKVRLVVDCINHRGTTVYAPVMLPPHPRVVTPTGGKMSVAMVHNCCECEHLRLAELIKCEGE